MKKNYRAEKRINRKYKDSLFFYYKKEQDSLYFRHFLKIVYKARGRIKVLWINLRKLKDFMIDIFQNLCNNVLRTK